MDEALEKALDFSNFTSTLNAQKRILHEKYLNELVMYSNNGKFTVSKELLNFCTVDLSAFYFDIRKDALYCDSKDTERRKGCIIVLNIILESLIKWFAPILSFTTEEIFTLISKDNKSIHLEEFMEFPKSFENEQLNKKWIELKKIRDICNISIEAKRASKEIGSSLEADVLIHVNEKEFKLLDGLNLEEYFITSKVEIIQNQVEGKMKIEVKKSTGSKCTLCWKILEKKCKRKYCGIN
jgi:isoleucyl-tRNA synthetase